jgi:hypothetical protein
MLDLLRSFLKALRVQFPNEPQWCALAAVRSVNLECQVVSSRVQQTYGKTWTTPGLLYALHSWRRGRRRGTRDGLHTPPRGLCGWHSARCRAGGLLASLAVFFSSIV